MDIYDVVDLLTPDVAGGMYRHFEETENKYVWAIRTTPSGKYDDDVIFELEDVVVEDDGLNQASYCKIEARSRSQSFSEYDFDTNFCNMWNVLSRVEGMGEVDITRCAYYPKDSEIQTTCDKY